MLVGKQVLRSNFAQVNLQNAVIIAFLVVMLERRLLQDIFLMHYGVLEGEKNGNKSLWTWLR